MLSAYLVLFLVSGSSVPTTTIVLADSPESATEEILSQSFCEILEYRHLGLAEEEDAFLFLSTPEAALAAKTQFEEDLLDDLEKELYD